MGYLEVKKLHGDEIMSWAAAYKFNYPDEYDALIAEHGEAIGNRIAAERRYEEYHQRAPDWPAATDDV